MHLSDSDPAELLRRERGDGNFYSLRGEEALTHLQSGGRTMLTGAAGRPNTRTDEERAANFTHAEIMRPVMGQLFQSAITAGKAMRTEIKEKTKHSCHLCGAACLL